MCKKQDLGQFFTKNDVWLKTQIEEFIMKSGKSIVLDPFCGGGDLLEVAKKLGFTDCRGMDIDKKLKWTYNDSLKGIARTDGIIITNPPYLAKNSAKRKLSSSYKYFEDNNYTDLYQIALARILESADTAVAIIPESYILTNLFMDRLASITVIEDNPFEDTECPVCVACFDNKAKELSAISVYKNTDWLFNMDELWRYKKTPKNAVPVAFNDVKGNIGIRCIDGVSAKDNICYTRPEDLNYDLSKIGVSSRSVTVASIETDRPVKKIITAANEILNDYREKTKDLLLCPFKGNQSDNTRRRRLDFTTCRAILEEAVAGV